MAGCRAGLPPPYSLVVVVVSGEAYCVAWLAAGWLAAGLASAVELNCFVVRCEAWWEPWLAAGWLLGLVAPAVEFACHGGACSLAAWLGCHRRIALLSWW